MADQAQVRIRKQRFSRVSLLIGQASELDIKVPEATDVEAYLRQSQGTEQTKWAHRPQHRRNTGQVQMRSRSTDKMREPRLNLAPEIAMGTNGTPLNEQTELQRVDTLPRRKVKKRKRET